jgi:osmotically-inducible protein OsmY
MKTDARLHQDIADELKWELGVHAKTVGLQARHGAVTLAGEVDIYAHKQRAACAAQRVSGVKSLTVQINVKRIGATAPYLQDFPDTQGMPPWATL